MILWGTLILVAVILGIHFWLKDKREKKEQVIYEENLILAQKAREEAKALENEVERKAALKARREQQDREAKQKKEREKSDGERKKKIAKDKIDKAVKSCSDRPKVTNERPEKAEKKVTKPFKRRGPYKKKIKKEAKVENKK